MESYDKERNISTIKIEPGLPMPAAPPGAPVGFMPTMAPIAGVPIGLEYLTQIDRLIIQQKVSLLEAVAGWEVKNKYAIYNSVGQQVYYAYEESGCCMRQCCGGQRGFTIHIVDNFNREVMRISRPFKCCTWCCFGEFPLLWF
ncbi:unnamed protein product, partial [Mesorhabditis belari]|uniref:Phospholipid scramblase n=1 Tax=Mesorhabditis belari TaxID=2138241 RepID=A0AAF3FPL1_9BILA